MTPGSNGCSSTPETPPPLWPSLSGRSGRSPSVPTSPASEWAGPSATHWRTWRPGSIGRGRCAMSEWRRVSRSHPCPVCGRPDWCLVAGPESEPEAAICPRVEPGKRVGDGGWLHRLRDREALRGRHPVRRVVLDCGPRPDFTALAESYRRCIDDARLQRFANSLGLQAPSLERFGVGWSPLQGAWSFPMRAGDGAVVGVHLRGPDGRKL